MQPSFWATVIWARAMTGRARDVPKLSISSCSCSDLVPMSFRMETHPKDKHSRRLRCIELQGSRAPQ